MEFIKPVAFNLKSDLKKIKAISEKKVTSLAANKPPSDNDFVRVYFVTFDNVPLAVFDDVPYDLYLKILCARRMTFDNGEDPEIIRLAVFDGKECLVVDWISIAPVIWASVLLSTYVVSDLRFFLTHGLQRFADALPSLLQKPSGGNKKGPRAKR